MSTLPTLCIVEKLVCQKFFGRIHGSKHLDLCCYSAILQFVKNATDSYLWAVLFDNLSERKSYPLIP